MKAWITCLAAGLCSLGCTGPVEISDYDAGAVIEGAARSSAGEPVVGAAVQVAAHRAGCDQQATATSGGGVFTGTDGRFEGEFSFLATGPVVVQCVGIQLVDTVTSTLVGDTLIAVTLRFDAVRSDTLEVELEF